MDTLPPPILNPPLEPAPVAFSYMAPGWWMILLLAIVLVYFLIKLATSYYRKTAYKREALAAAKALNENTPDEQFLAVLRNTAIQAYGRENVAAVHGKEWAGLLEKAIDHKRSVKEFEQLFNNDLYKNTALQVDKAELKDFIIYWINHHATRLA